MAEVQAAYLILLSFVQYVYLALVILSEIIIFTTNFRSHIRSLEIEKECLWNWGLIWAKYFIEEKNDFPIMTFFFFTYNYLNF